MEHTTRTLLKDEWRVSPSRCPKCGAKLLICPSGQLSWQLCQGWHRQLPTQGSYVPLLEGEVPYHNWVWIGQGPIIPLGN